MIPLVGQTLLGRYFLREHIDSGGMAEVFLAWDQERSTRMAVKVLRRDLNQNERFIQMFNKEAETLRSLEHPNIVRLYELQRENELCFIVMDWVEGKNLSQLIQAARAPLPLVDVLRVLIPVSSALNYAHQKQIYHCDVKPANIMLHVDGRVLLTDFGVAHWAEADFHGGTPAYMAPEQFDDADIIDARTDVYALGVTLYEMLTGGTIPFKGDSPGSHGSTPRERIAWEHYHLPVPPLRSINPAIPETIEQLVVRAMSKERTDRFPSTLILRESFEKAAAFTAGSIRENSVLARLLLSPPRQPVGEPAQREPVQRESAKAEVVRQIQRPLSPAPAAVPRTAQARGPRLVCRQGMYAGKIFPVTAAGLIIGRGTRCQLRLREPAVSRRHATVFCGPKGLIYLRDEASTLGTFVNGARIQGVVYLKPGDLIQIGYQQVFEYRED